MSLIYEPEEDSYLLSEVLKEETLELIKTNKNLKFLEMGCGSGINLQIALKLGIKKENIFGVDINKDAVNYCKKIGFNSVQSNLFSRIKGKFDLIIINPPYLPENKDEDKESQLVTTGGKSGSELINKFLKQSKNYIKNNGEILLVTSSLTKGIKWNNFKKKKLETKELFFEEIYVWKIRI